MGGIEVTGRRGRRHRKLLDDLKKRRRYSHLKEEALDRTMWWARFGRSLRPVVRQTTKWMNECYSYLITQRSHIDIDTVNGRLESGLRLVLRIPTPHWQERLLLADHEMSGQMKFVPILCKILAAHAVSIKTVVIWDVMRQSLVNR
jgi:hypothetical protein